jgi:hypothetical protein
MAPPTASTESTSVIGSQPGWLILTLVRPIEQAILQWGSPIRMKEAQ